MQTSILAISSLLGLTAALLLHDVQTVDADRRLVEIEIKMFMFDPDTLRVEPGTAVRWINRDPVGHTSTAETGEWESPLLGPGESFEFRFDEEGTFSYNCTPHPFMRGAVIVESSGRKDGQRLSQEPNQEKP
jgi:plastocyanin